MGLLKPRDRLEKWTIGALWAGLQLLYILLALQNAGGSLMAYIRPIGAVTGALGVFALFRWRLFPARIYPELWLYGLYVLAACVPGLFLAVDRTTHIDMALRIAQGAAMVVAVYALLGLCSSPRPMLWILLGGALAYAVYGFAGGLAYYRVFRQTIGNINSNVFARVPMFAFLGCLGLMNGYRGWKRLAFLPALAVCAYLVLVSGSRTAYLALGAGAVAYIALTAPRADLRGFYLKALLPAAVALTVGGVIYLAVRDPYLLKSVWTRVGMLFSDGNDSASIRFSAIEKALSQFCAHPVFGIGAYQFGRITGGELNHSHCDIAELLMSYGLAGTLLYIGACVYGMRGVWRALRREGLKNPPAQSVWAAMAALYVAYGVVGLGDITIYEMTCQMLLGALTACGMCNRLAGKTP